tara:strand:+ start:8836 stop:9594 length:759 start_codon:yes stop_codon:yes gene_type:complete
VAFVDMNTQIEDTDEIIFGDEISNEGSNEYNSSFDIDSDSNDENSVYYGDVNPFTFREMDGKYFPPPAISSINTRSTIENKSAILPNEWMKWHEKLKRIIASESEEKLFTDEEEELPPQQDIQMPRVLQALADLVERYRRNTNDILDPPLITKKKEQRMMQKKNKDFMDTKAKQLVIAIVEHLEHLIIYGNYPKEMFGNYDKYAMESIRGSSYESLHAGLKLLMCAETIIPSAELIQPIKRISTALPTGVSQ